ncbi:MATE family efflux transporter [Nonlabens marinus]|uniref:Multidrug-efflux transporter n=1 Tax=Nonlabens marinus S1-08 TaxID=1454201 RepID=W8VNR7_9FLAO|nr:MATE family efflux transporter [Nonlabens marinus]BAO54614.1 DNA-damage-inducible protein F [Nonlabens marinus S1-08]
MKSTINISTSDILKLAFPAIIAGIAEPVISITDIAIIGNMENNSVDALAAVGLAGAFLSTIIWTLAQTKTSISSIVSKALGKDTLNKVDALIPQVIWINIALGLGVYAITVPFASFIFSLYGAQGEVLEMTASYYQLRAIGFPLTLSAFAIFGIFRGLQNTSWAMIASISGALVNVVLDILLVNGIEGWFLGMGLTGAAIASLFAQVTMLVIALFYFFNRTPFTLWIQQWKPHLQLSHHIKLTANFFLRTLAINICIYLSYRYATGYGVEEAATHAILMNIWLFFSFFIDGFANAGNAIGGKLLGSRDRESLKYLALKTNSFGVGVSITLSLMCALLYYQVGDWFTDDSAVQQLFIQTFFIILLMQPVNAVAFVYDGIFKGWGEAPYLRNLLLGVTLLLFIPTLLLFDFFGFELKAIWIAFFAWMIGRALLLHLKFKKRLDAMV